MPVQGQPSAPLCSNLRQSLICKMAGDADLELNANSGALVLAFLSCTWQLQAPVAKGVVQRCS